MRNGEISINCCQTGIFGCLSHTIITATIPLIAKTPNSPITESNNTIATSHVFPEKICDTSIWYYASSPTSHELLVIMREHLRIDLADQFHHHTDDNDQS